MRPYLIHIKLYSLIKRYVKHSPSIFIHISFFIFLDIEKNYYKPSVFSILQFMNFKIYLKCIKNGGYNYGKYTL